MDGNTLTAIIMAFLFGWIPLKVVLGHIARMAEIKARASMGGEGIARQLAEMQEELKALRETTTRFDVSFDAALTRLEQRMDILETDRLRTGYETAESPEQAALKTRY